MHGVQKLNLKINTSHNLKLEFQEIKNDLRQVFSSHHSTRCLEANADHDFDVPAATIFRNDSSFVLCR